MSDITFSSQNVTFQVRCDAASLRGSVFEYFQNVTIFLELGTNVTILSHRNIIFLDSAVRLGTNPGLKTLFIC